MTKKFRASPLYYENNEQVLDDIRELLFMMLHAQLAGPDPSGYFEPIRRRLARFVELRMEEEAEEGEG